jgi:lambda family phage portal protein
MKYVEGAGLKGLSLIEHPPVARADIQDGYATVGGVTGFNAATQGRRLAGYAGTTRGINSLALFDGTSLRARARKAAIDNPWAVSAIRGFKADVVGDGIKPHFQHPKAEVRTVLKKAWDRSAKEMDSSYDPATRKGVRNFYGQQAHLAGEVMEAGEGLARLRRRYLADGFTVPLQIQLIDSEQLPYWKMDGAYGNNIVRGGIEFDMLGRRVAYHMYRQNPGDNLMWPNALEIIRVPGEDVLHVFDPLRGNPIRGITWFASVLIKLEDLRQTDDATLLRQKMSSFFVGWKTQVNPTQPLLPTTTTVGTSTAPDSVGFGEIEAGTVLDMDPGDKLEWSSPPQPGVDYDVFVKTHLRAISRVLMRAYHQLSGDPSDANFTSLRADLLNSRRELEQFQFNVICLQFCDPVIKAWMDQAALAGVIDIADYKKNQADYLDIEWRTARWAWVDPLKDMMAEKMANRSGYKSRSATILEMGSDPEQVDAEIKLDQQRADSSGLVFDSDGRRPDGRGATDVSPEAESAAGSEKPKPGKKLTQAASASLEEMVMREMVAEMMAEYKADQKIQ